MEQSSALHGTQAAANSRPHPARRTAASRSASTRRTVAPRSARASATAALLGPALRSSRGTPHVRVLAVLAKAAAAGIPLNATKTFLLASDRPDIAAVAAQTRLLGSLHASAAARARLSSCAGGRAALTDRVATNLVGHLLLPAPVSGLSVKRVVAARAALAWIGGDILRSTDEHGYDSALFSVQRLADGMSVSRSNAGFVLTACVELGWLTRTTDNAGAPNRYRIAPLTGAHKAAVWDLREVVDALVGQCAGGDDEYPYTNPDRAGRLLRSAGHPAWAYTGLGLTGLLVAVADQANVDPSVLGPGVGTVRKARGAITAAGLDVGDLTESLNRLAHETGASIRSVEASQATDRAAAARLEAVKAERALRKVVGLILKAGGPIPDFKTAEVEVLRTWAAAVIAAGRIAVHGGPRKAPVWAGTLEPLGVELNRRLRKAGSDEGQAAFSTRRVMDGISAAA
jgi:hypothetical protein